MDERYRKRIGDMRSWKDLNELENNFKRNDAWSEEVAAVFKNRSTQLGIEYILAETGLPFEHLSNAEKAIVLAIGEYAAIMKRQGKTPTRTLPQIRALGLIDAAEAAVCKKRPTQGYQVLVDANLEDLSYESIILEHPDEFSERAMWFSRRTLGLENSSSKPPAPTHSDINTRTAALLDWMKGRAAKTEGIIGPFTNADAATAIGLGALRTFGRVHGNIQSRIDFACYLCDLPPLGCAAVAPFEKAWGQDDRNWAFPIDGLQQAAQGQQWSSEDFQRIADKAMELPGIAYLPWREALSTEEQRVRVWAYRWAKAAASSSTDDQRHLYRLPSDVLDLATPEYVWAAVQRQKLGETTPHFGPSTDFDLVVDTHRFPPKAVFGMALSMAMGGQEVLPKHFTGGEGSACFRLLREAGFSVVLKDHLIAEAVVQEAPEEEWAEGTYRLVPHWKRERAAGLSRAKKAQYRRLHGKLTCERCGLDPVQIFGSDVGEACIEVHHARIQVSEMPTGHVTLLEDLQCLCANCHRVVHRLMVVT